jgi:DNA-binding transcriptional regulator YiaG
MTDPKPNIRKQRGTTSDIPSTRICAERSDIAACPDVSSAAIRRKQLVGRNVRRARKLAGLSQVKFAPKIGVTQSYLSDYERGRTEPGPARLERIAEETGVDLAFFFAEHPELDEEEEFVA